MFKIFKRSPLKILNRNVRHASKFQMRLDFPNQLRENSMVFIKESRRFMQECLLRVGVPRKYMRCICDFMLAADYRGIYGFGLHRLDALLNDIHHGYVDINAEPSVIQESVATAHVNGNSALGVLVGNFCMDIAVAKARKAGVGVVVAKHSHYIGLPSWYLFRALSEGYVGLVMTNGPPVLVGPGAQAPSVGGNRLAFGCKAASSHLILDVATTYRDLSDIEWAHLRNELIPHGLAFEECGVSTPYASQAVALQHLFPAGGHKGYCLAALIDVLCGVMSGSNFSTQIPRWWSECQGAKPNLGQFFLAIDPCVCLPDFKERLEDFNNRIKACCPVDKKNPVLLPGEREKRHMDYVDDSGVLLYPNVLLAKYKLIAEMLCVPPLQLAYGGECDKSRCN